MSKQPSLQHRPVESLVSLPEKSKTSFIFTVSSRTFLLSMKKHEHFISSYILNTLPTVGSSESLRHMIFPPKFPKALRQSPEDSFCIFWDTKQYKKPGLPYTFLSQAEDKCVILTSRLSFITWDIVVAFKSNLIHHNVNWQSKIWPFLTQPAKKYPWQAEAHRQEQIPLSVPRFAQTHSLQPAVPTWQFWKSKPCLVPLLFAPQSLIFDWGMRSTKNTKEILTTKIHKEILTHKVTVLLHRSFLCQMQLVQVCHHVSHLPFQWARTGTSYAGKSPRSLFQEGPLMVHVERADGICSKPQLDHPEKMPLLSQPLSFNTCMGGPKSP